MDILIKIFCYNNNNKKKMVKVLVLGGVGFIGRNLCSYLIENDLVEQVTVADKVLPATAYLSPKHKEAFDSPKLTFKQANLTNSGIIEKYNNLFNIYSLFLYKINF